MERQRPVGLSAWGPLLAVLGVLGFSFKAILIKLAYAWAPIDPVTLMTLRMLYSAPFFVGIAWWSGRAPGAARIGARDARLLLGLGFVGYYLASLLDFIGLQYVTASLERLVLFLYPTIVVLLSAPGRDVTGGDQRWLDEVDQPSRPVAGRYGQLHVCAFTSG